MSVEAAAAWYEYGNVLLLKEEENPSNDLLGNVQNDHPENAPEDEDVGEDEGEEQEDTPDDAGDDEAEEGDDVEGDLQIAWEALDVCICTSFVTSYFIDPFTSYMLRLLELL